MLHRHRQTTEKFKSCEKPNTQSYQIMDKTNQIDNESNMIQSLTKYGLCPNKTNGFKLIKRQRINERYYLEELSRRLRGRLEIMHQTILNWLQTHRPGITFPLQHRRD